MVPSERCHLAFDSCSSLFVALEVCIVGYSVHSSFGGFIPRTHCFNVQEVNKG